VRIAGEEIVRPLGIIHARSKPLPPTAARFVDLLRGHANDLSPADDPSADVVAHA
jgi:hypothetical protein